MKKLFFLIIAVCALSVSAFADASYFSDSTFRANGSGYYYEYTGSSDLVSFYLKYGYADSSWVRVYAISTVQNASLSYTTSGSGTTSVSCSAPAGDCYIAALQMIQASQFSSVPELTIFSFDTSDADIASAYGSYISPPELGVQSSFSLPCGNVAYFQVSSAQTVNFKSTYQILSKFFANSTYGYWSDSGQRFGPAASLPTSSTSFPIASQDPLYWTPDSQSKNLLGLSKTGLASESCIVGQWYAFYNPAYNSNNTDWTTMDITGATVTVSGSFSEIKIYPLEQVVDYQNGSFVGSSNDNYQSYFDGNIGADGSVSFTDQDGVSSVPTAGGQNLLAPNETAQSLVEKVVGILQNLLSEIQSLFTFGYDAIQSLVGIMSSFVSSFSQLYTWLPTEVYSALISAVIIAVVIGIFKVFL